MGLFDLIFGGSERKHSTKKSSSNGNAVVRSRSTIISNKSKNSRGTHETIFSKSSHNPRTGKSSYQEGWHGPKHNK